MDESLVIAAAGADRPRPASMAVVAGTQMMRFEKVIARGMIDAFALHISHFTDRRIDETMANVDIAGRSHSQQSQPRATGISFTDPRVQLLQRVVRVGESVL